MQITFKTITQQAFEIDAQPEETVTDLKKKIEAEKGVTDYPVDAQKLIYNGKVLGDTQTVAEINSDPVKFIFILVSKKKAPSVDLAASSAASAAVLPPISANNTSMPTVAAAISAAPVEAALSAETEEAIVAIMGMGYEGTNAIRWWTPCAPPSTIPIAPSNTCSREFRRRRTMETVVQKKRRSYIFGLISILLMISGVEMTFQEMLPLVPQLEVTRQLVRGNPELLPGVIQQIAQSNPDLMDLILCHVDDFLEHLVQLTAQEQAGIDRLKAMGFPEALVVEAYFASGKDEAQAVDYILLRMDEFQAELDAPEGQP